VNPFNGIERYASCGNWRIMSISPGIHSMELKVLGRLSPPSLRSAFRIHSMELKGPAGELEQPGNLVALRNPFNGIESHEHAFYPHNVKD